MTAHRQWPHTLKDAIAAEIIRWDSNSIGVAGTARHLRRPIAAAGRLPLATSVASARRS
jgi:hypothetical protein